MANNKDHISVYVFRNYLVTIIVAFISMITSLMSFYQCSLLEAVRRVLLYDLYTTLYFMLIWMVDYIVFEISKICLSAPSNRNVLSPNTTSFQA